MTNCVYVGTIEEGERVVRVVARADDELLLSSTVSERGVLLPARVDLLAHGSRFQWGVSTAGAAQLALAMLAHYYEQNPEAARAALDGVASNVPRMTTSEADRAALRWHLRFKRKCIAQLPVNEPWVLTTHELAVHLLGHTVGRANEGLEQVVAALGGAARELLPANTGFIAIVFDYGPGGAMTYASSAGRAGSVTLLRELADKLEAS